MSEKQEQVIDNMRELCAFIGSDGPSDLNRRIYKDTECGASISVLTPDGYVHNGQHEKWKAVTFDTPLRGFTIQTTIENSDATVQSQLFEPGVQADVVQHFIDEMEQEADALWQEANNFEPQTYEDAVVYMIEECGWELGDTHGWNEKSLLQEAKQAWRNRQ